MKRGFALLETLIVITFLTVSLLLLYGTFTNMLNNSKKNILYDNASNIYKAYYTKEYLNLGNLKYIETDNIREITCDILNMSGCEVLIKKLEISKMYIARYDLKDYDKSIFSSSLNNYLDTLSNKGENRYRLILEFNNNDTLSYSSIGINEVYYE